MCTNSASEITPSSLSFASLANSSAMDSEELLYDLSYVFNSSFSMVSRLVFTWRFDSCPFISTVLGGPLLFSSEWLELCRLHPLVHQ